MTENSLKAKINSRYSVIDIIQFFVTTEFEVKKVGKSFRINPCPFTGNEKNSFALQRYDDGFEVYYMFSTDFIDEAYELAPSTSVFGKTADHGGEAITEMINFIDKNIGLGVIIAAGYEDEMEERFMKSNQGMARRFPHVFRLDNYNTKQLADILLKFLEDSLDDEIEITDGDASVLYTILHNLLKYDLNLFPKQAGDMLILSGFISKQIYASNKYKWDNGNPKNNSAILTTGINTYLNSHNIQVAYE